LLSPATILEHEFDHAVAANTDLLSYLKRYFQVDLEAGNKEEWRDMHGSERKTAFKNKEFNSKQQRYQHDGDFYPVIDPTTTKPNNANYMYNSQIIYFWVSENPNITVTYK
jgi:hypothetical protein